MTELTDEQDASLLLFGEITGCSVGQEGGADRERALGLLRAHGWRMERALAAFFDGGSPLGGNDGNPSATASAMVGSTRVHQDEDTGSVRRRHPPPTSTPDQKEGSASTPAIPWEKTQFNSSSSAASPRSTLWWTLISFPYRLVKLILSTALSLLTTVTKFLTFGSSHGEADGEIPSFPQYFASRFGSSNAAPLFDGHYQQAVHAAKQNKQGLLIFILSERPAHKEQSALVCTDILANPDFISFVQEHHLLVWAGEVSKQAKVKRLAQSLRVTSFPCIAILLHGPETPTPHSTVSSFQTQTLTLTRRWTGFVPLPSLIVDISDEWGKMERAKNFAVLAQQEAEMNARIRSDQNAAFEASLRADRAKAQSRAAEEARVAAEREAQAAAQAAEVEQMKARVQRIKERRLAAVTGLAPEPEASATVTNIGFRLPSGSRVTRRFYCSDTIQTLHDFVDTLDWSPLAEGAEVDLYTIYPRRCVSSVGNAETVTLTAAGLTPSASLVVEERDF